MGCNNRSCLYSLSAFDIVDAQYESYLNRETNGKTYMIEMLFTPTIIPLSVNSTSLLTTQPFIAFNQGNFVNPTNGNNVTILNGVNNDEGWAFLLSPNMSELEYNRDMRRLFKNGDDMEQVKKEYSHELINETYANNMALIVTDMMFKCPNHNITLAMSQIAESTQQFSRVLNVNNMDDKYNYKNVYFYHFNANATFGKYLTPQSQCYTRSCHGSELVWVFGPSFGNLDYKYDIDHQVEFGWID